MGVLHAWKGASNFFHENGNNIQTTLVGKKACVDPSLRDTCAPFRQIPSFKERKYPIGLHLGQTKSSHIQMSAQPEWMIADCGWRMSTTTTDYRIESAPAAGASLPTRRSLEGFLWLRYQFFLRRANEVIHCSLRTDAVCLRRRTIPAAPDDKLAPLLLRLTSPSDPWPPPLKVHSPSAFLLQLWRGRPARPPDPLHFAVCQGFAFRGRSATEDGACASWCDGGPGVQHRPRGRRLSGSPCRALSRGHAVTICVLLAFNLFGEIIRIWSSALVSLNLFGEIIQIRLLAVLECVRVSPWYKCPGVSRSWVVCRSGAWRRYFRFARWILGLRTTCGAKSWFLVSTRALRWTIVFVLCWMSNSFLNVEGGLGPAALPSQCSISRGIFQEVVPPPSPRQADAQDVVRCNSVLLSLRGLPRLRF